MILTLNLASGELNWRERERALTLVQVLQRMIAFLRYTVAEPLEPLCLFLPVIYTILISIVTEGIYRELASK